MTLIVELLNFVGLGKSFRGLRFDYINSSFSYNLNWYSPFKCSPEISNCKQVAAFSERRPSVTKDARVRALGTLLALLCQDHLDVRGLRDTFHTIDVHKLFYVPDVLVVFLTVWDNN